MQINFVRSFVYHIFRYYLYKIDHCLIIINFSIEQEPITIKISILWFFYKKKKYLYIFENRLYIVHETFRNIFLELRHRELVEFSLIKRTYTETNSFRIFFTIFLPSLCSLPCQLIKISEAISRLLEFVEWLFHDIRQKEN